MAKKIFIVRHVDYVRLGHLPEVLEEMNLPYEQISLSLGEPLPDLHRVRGVISMGGPMSAYEIGKYHWIEQEMDFQRKIVQAGIPFLGICLGGQILAQTFGGSVIKADQLEVGWVDLQKSEEAKDDPIFRDLEVPPLFQLHYDVIRLPKDAVNLLISKRSSVQCFRTAPRVYGVQFHPEANREMLTSVADEYREKLSAYEIEKLLSGLDVKVQEGRKFLKEFLRGIFE